MSFNFNSNNTTRDNKALTKNDKISYEPVTEILKNTLSAEFPIVPNNKDILQLLMHNYFNKPDFTTDEALVTDYNNCMDLLSLNTILEDKFDTFFVFVCVKDVDPLFYKHIPVMVKNKQGLKKKIYKLVQLPYGSFATLNKNKVSVQQGVFILRFDNKDKALQKNLLYINIISKVPDI
ncbi:hypothetical protein QEN19_001940 [Hanseniaspora menglaensis]